MTTYFQEISIVELPEANGSSLKFFQDFNFDTKRVFFVRASKQGDIRGRHAHKKCRQLIYVLNGEFQITLKLRNGATIYKEKLHSNKKAILIQPDVWVELEALDPDSIFSCLCDRPYSENDYIRQSNAFFSDVKGF